MDKRQNTRKILANHILDTLRLASRTYNKKTTRKQYWMKNLSRYSLPKKTEVAK